jgi:HlyD family secretion protein
MDFKQLGTRAKDFYGSHKKWVLIGGGVLGVAVVGAVLLFMGGSTSEEMHVVYMDVTTGAITESIDVVGSLEAVPSITLAWESDGIVSDFDINVGDSVEKDQVLMTLEDSSVSSEILQAQASLLDAQAELENLKVSNTDLHTAAQTLADLEYAFIDYKADRDYWNYKGASWDSVEQARVDYYAHEQISWEKQAAYDALSHLEPDDPERLAAYEEQKEAILEADKYLHYISNLLGVYYDHAVETDFIEYDKALGDVEQARNEYNRYLDQTEEIAAAEANVQALQNTIDQSRIVAPFAGTVTEVISVSGEYVSAGDQALRIDNLDHLMVDVYVSEVDINKVEIGQAASLVFDALPNQEYSGFVESISSAGNDESGVVEFRVSVVIEDADEAVKPGFTTVVSIITSEVDDALLIPTQAIQTQNGVPVVMRVNADGSTIAVPVELGAVSDLNTQVLSGDISVGDKLAVSVNTAEKNEFNPKLMGPVIKKGSDKK